MYYDKKVSKIKGKKRIPEKDLFMLSVLGGSLGIFTAMYLFRHKTLHKRFVFGVPAIILMQIIIILYLM